MSILNVKIPAEMDEDLEAFLEDHPHCLNKSELVRDALRHLIETPRLSDRTLEYDRVSREQIESGYIVALDEMEDWPDHVLNPADGTTALSVRTIQY